MYGALNGTRIFHDERLVHISETTLSEMKPFLPVIFAFIGPEKMEMIFGLVLDKLEERELSLCLWLFLKISFDRNLNAL